MQKIRKLTDAHRKQIACMHGHSLITDLAIATSLSVKYRLIAFLAGLYTDSILVSVTENGILCLSGCITGCPVD